MRKRLASQGLKAKLEHQNSATEKDRRVKEEKEALANTFKNAGSNDTK